LIRAVVDTSILVRALLKPRGTVGPVLDLLLAGRFTLLYSASILEELQDVLRRPRLRRRFPMTDEDVDGVLELIVLRGEEIVAEQGLSVSRDPKDDKFLEVAVEGRADVIVTGDEDLLVLDPYESIPIVGARAFLEMLESSTCQRSQSRRTSSASKRPSCARVQTLATTPATNRKPASRDVTTSPSACISAK